MVSDSIIRRENRGAWNKVARDMQKWRTMHLIAKSVNVIIEALVYDEQPIKPSFPNTVLGELLQVAWVEQEATGWVKFCKGRLSRMWGKVQAMLYSSGLDLWNKKHLNKSKWALKIV